MEKSDWNSYKFKSKSLGEEGWQKLKAEVNEISKEKEGLDKEIEQIMTKDLAQLEVDKERVVNNMEKSKKFLKDVIELKTRLMLEEREEMLSEINTGLSFEELGSKIVSLEKNIEGEKEEVDEKKLKSYSSIKYIFDQYGLEIPDLRYYGEQENADIKEYYQYIDAVVQLQKAEKLPSQLSSEDLVKVCINMIAATASVELTQFFRERAKSTMEEHKRLLKSIKNKFEANGEVEKSKDIEDILSKFDVYFNSLQSHFNDIFTNGMFYYVGHLKCTTTYLRKLVEQERVPEAMIFAHERMYEYSLRGKELATIVKQKEVERLTKYVEMLIEDIEDEGKQEEERKIFEAALSKSEVGSSSELYDRIGTLRVLEKRMEEFLNPKLRGYREINKYSVCYMNLSEVLMYNRRERQLIMDKVKEEGWKKLEDELKELEDELFERSKERKELCVVTDDLSKLEKLKEKSVKNMEKSKSFLLKLAELKIESYISEKNKSILEVDTDYSLEALLYNIGDGIEKEAIIEREKEERAVISKLEKELLEKYNLKMPGIMDYMNEENIEELKQSMDIAIKENSQCNMSIGDIMRFEIVIHQIITKMEQRKFFKERAENTIREHKELLESMKNKFSKEGNIKEVKDIENIMSGFDVFSNSLIAYFGYIFSVKQSMCFYCLKYRTTYFRRLVENGNWEGAKKFALEKMSDQV